MSSMRINKRGECLAFTRYLLLSTLLVVAALARVEAQEAHTHGLATLTLALEGETLEMQFESPAANLVGFEHKATSSEEKAAVTKAEVILKDAARLFSFVGSGCQFKNALVDVSSVAQNHQHHDHASEHDESSHSEISAIYRYQCKDAQALESVSVALFESFAGIEKIDAMWITESDQGSAPLTTKSNLISLR